MPNKKNTTRPRARSAWSLPDDIVYTVARLRFCEGMSPTKIVPRMREDRGVRISREQVYGIIEEAFRRGFMQINCPLGLAAADALADAYAISRAVSISVAPPIQVVNTPAADARKEIARQAARTAYQIIVEIGARKGANERVHVAFASGSMTQLILQRLVDLIRNAPKGFPKLTLHAASPGISVDVPESTIGVSFNLFRDVALDIQYVTFPSAPIVPADQYEEHKALPGLREAFARAEEVDLLITSMGSADDEDGEIRRLLSRSAKHSTTERGPGSCDASADARTIRLPIDDRLAELFATLKRRGWVGDVQYQPYSADGPIDTGAGLRAVTLFSIADLVAFAAKPNKAVLLVCGPCLKHHRSRSEALVPLLQNPKLRVWSYLVVDLRTAEECTQMASTLKRTA